MKIDKITAIYCSKSDEHDQLEEYFFSLGYTWAGKETHIDYNINEPNIILGYNSLDDYKIHMCSNETKDKLRGINIDCNQFINNITIEEELKKIREIIKED